MILVLLIQHFNKYKCSDANEVSLLYDKVADLEKKARIRTHTNAHRVEESLIIKAIQNMATEEDRATYETHYKKQFHYCNEECFGKLNKFENVWPFECKLMQGLTILKTTSQAIEYVKKCLVENLIICFGLELEKRSYDNISLKYNMFVVNEPEYNLSFYNIITSELYPITVCKDVYAIMSKIGSILDTFYSYSNRFTSLKSVFANPRARSPNNVTVYDMIEYHLVNLELLVNACHYLYSRILPLAINTANFKPLLDVLNELYNEQNETATAEERQELYLKNTKNIFDIYHIFRRTVANLITHDNMQLPDNKLLPYLCLYSPIKKHFGAASFRDIPNVNNLRIHSFDENKVLVNVVKELQKNYLEHMKLQYSMLNSSNQDELELNCTKFVNNLFYNIDNNFTLRYFDLIIRNLYPAAVRYALTTHGLLN